MIKPYAMASRTAIANAGSKPHAGTCKIFSSTARTNCCWRLVDFIAQLNSCRRGKLDFPPREARDRISNTCPILYIGLCSANTGDGRRSKRSRFCSLTSTIVQLADCQPPSGHVSCHFQSVGLIKLRCEFVGNNLCQSITNLDSQLFCGSRPSS